MFEHRKSQLATNEQFQHRLLKAGLFSFFLFGLSLAIGICGYHFIADLGWVDSFLNASMILGGMEPVDILKSDSSKIFAGCYSIFSGVALLSGMAVFLTPILHRFLHKFHIDPDEGEREK